MDNSIKHHALEFLSDQEAEILEDKSWWVQGRKSIIRKYLSLATLGIEFAKILDIGCGSGGNFDVLREFGIVYGCEPSPVLASRARARRIAHEVYENDTDVVLSKVQCNVLTLFDVLEHISDDNVFIKNITKSLITPHSILISVPAHPFLFSEHDRLLNHKRRYTKARLANVLLENGYKIRFISHHMTILFPIAMIVRAKERALASFGRKRVSVDMGDVPASIGVVLQRVLACESILVPHFELPIGLWLFCVACRE
jgi:SAM-dependent methyltransferase